MISLLYVFNEHTLIHKLRITKIELKCRLKVNTGCRRNVCALINAIVLKIFQNTNCFISEVHVYKRY